MTSKRASTSFGLRIQILAALTVLLALSFVPLFFAVTKITGATLRGARESEARATAQALAIRAEAARASGGSFDELIAHQAEALPLEAVSIFDEAGRRIAFRGEGAPKEVPQGGSDIVATAPKSLEVVATSGTTTVVVRLWARDVTTAIEGVQRLLALYVGLFAMALLTFAYLALTRLIVRPVEGLVRDTERIAQGSRVELEGEGPSELRRLSRSISVMATSLLAKEEAMRKKVDELSRTTVKLQATETQLVGSEHMASVGRLAAGVAHEIGNPIAAILGMEELLLAGGLEEQEQRDFLDRMKRETERVHTVLRDLLDYARQGRGKDDVELENPLARVRNVVEDVTSLVRPQKDFKGITVKTDVDEDLAVAIAPSRLAQVLLNLVLNAGAALRGRATGTISIVGRREGERGVIRVSDDGPGVPAAVKDLIFDPFFTTKDVGEGTGLGLSVCRGIVSAHGGSIRLEEEKSDGDRGVGAMFVVDLPLALPPSAKA